MIEARMYRLLPAWIGLLTVFLPICSNAEEPVGGQKTDLKPDRYIGSSADWEKLRKDLEGDSDNSQRRARHLEAREIAAGAPGVRRDGRILFLKTHDGMKLPFEDDAPGDWAPSYSYYDVVPSLVAYVLHAQYPEGNSWLLVSRKTGTRTKTSGLPVVSPDKRRFLTGSYDMVADYNPNEVVVWKIDDDGTHQVEWKTEPTKWGPTFLRWLSPSKFQVRCESPHWYPEKPAPKPMLRTFELIEDKWKQVGDADTWEE